MNCSKCGTKTKVVDTGTDGKRVYRKRLCPNCGHKIYTTELVVEGSKYFLSKIRKSIINNR